MSINDQVISRLLSNIITVRNLSDGRSYYLKNQNQFKYEIRPTRDGYDTMLISIRIQAFTNPGPMEDQSVSKQ